MTNTNPLNTPRNLDEQRREFAQRRGLAMPLAGAVAWTIVGVAGDFLTPILEVWLLFGPIGFILPLGIFFSRFTGENFFDKQRPKNVFDGLFFRTVGEALLVLRHRDSFLSRGLHVVAIVGGHTQRFDVVAFFLDDRALDRHFPQQWRARLL